MQPRNRRTASSIPIVAFFTTAGAKLEGGMGGGGVTPPKIRIICMDWQGESSGLAGHSKILNDRM